MEFGPCKHGKFSETEYQETFVYDIVSHCDALRHPVMVDDNVLAPWEPEGERYAPAVVISGLEKRMADGKTLLDAIIRSPEKRAYQMLLCCIAVLPSHQKYSTGARKPIPSPTSGISLNRRTVKCEKKFRIAVIINFA